MSSGDSKPGDKGIRISVQNNEGVAAGVINGPVAVGKKAKASQNVHHHYAPEQRPRGPSIMRAPALDRNSAPRMSAQAVSAPSRKVCIFLASSAELRDDRDKFDLFFRQQNDAYIKRGRYLEIVRWETSTQALSATRLQDEYNRTIAGSDLFVSLFSGKVGRYTEEEFDVAERHFREFGKPLVFTFFKDVQVNMAQARREDLMSLWSFQDKLQSLGHFYSHYSSVEDLQNQFTRQLEMVFGDSGQS